MKNNALLFLVLAFQLGLCVDLLSAQPPGWRVTGTYGNMFYDEPSTDYFGFEVSFLYTDDGYAVVYQEACGDVHNLQVAKPEVDGNKFTFDVDSYCDETVLHLVAEVFQDRIDLYFTNKYVSKHMFSFNKTLSFWDYDYKRCKAPCSLGAIISSKKTPPSGVFGTYHYNSTSDTYSGIEIKVVSGKIGEHYEDQGTILVADGGPGRLFFMKPTIDKKRIQFDVPFIRQTCRFDGSSYELGILGAMTCPDGTKTGLVLPRRASYWDLPR